MGYDGFFEKQKHCIYKKDTFFESRYLLIRLEVHMKLSHKIQRLNVLMEKLHNFYEMAFYII